MTTFDPQLAWLFDLDGTLYHPLPVRALMALELLTMGLGSLPTIQAFRDQHERMRELPADDSIDPFERQLRLTAAELGQDREQVALVVREWMQRRPSKWLKLFKRRSLLRRIAAHRKAGGRAALVSDYPAQHKLQAMAIADLFEAVIASGEPGGPQRLKPDPDGYLLAARALGVEPAQCLVIGDRADADGAAAKAAGMAFQLV
jgi:putative hydrolase of the HAD superfamily